MDADPDSRLKNSIARNHDVLPRINYRPVQRMRQSSDQTMSRAPRQFGVCVESDHKAHFRQHGKIANLDRKAVALAGKQLVKVHQLAAFALPSHPYFFAGIVDAMAV